MARILAVDDALVMRNLVKTTLEAAGHEVTVMEDGLKALSFARHEKVDLVLSDQYMPGIKGTVFIRRLRDIEAYENIPILMLTTETDDAVKAVAKGNGADGWIQKPVVPDSLVSCVETMLEKFNFSDRIE